VLAEYEYDPNLHLDVSARHDQNANASQSLATGKDGDRQADWKIW
jgi:hypothetical protein